VAIIIAQHLSHILRYYQSDRLFHSRWNLPEKSVTSDASVTNVINVISVTTFITFVTEITFILYEILTSSGP